MLTITNTLWRSPRSGLQVICPAWEILKLNKTIKGEVRTINDRNIYERRSCMKNNGKSPTFKFVSGEERRPSEVQRVSRGWRLSGATHSSADLTWIRKRLKIQAPELSELESVELELGSCCSDLDKQVLDEIRRTRRRQFESPISSLGRVMPPSDFVLDSSWSSFSQTKKNWPERLLPGPSTPQTLAHMWNSFSPEHPLQTNTFLRTFSAESCLWNEMKWSHVTCTRCRYAVAVEAIVNGEIWKMASAPRSIF